MAVEIKREVDLGPGVKAVEFEVTEQPELDDEVYQTGLATEQKLAYDESFSSRISPQTITGPSEPTSA